MFLSSKERKESNSTAYLEFQYCKLKEGTPLRKIVNSTEFWLEDSLYVYVDDFEDFAKYYNGVFDCCSHSDGSTIFDVCGINYYTKKTAEKIATLLESKKPLDHETLLRWLKNAYESYNGFYILGI